MADEKKDKPCPNCGHCPTCGKSNHLPAYYGPYWYYQPPYWTNPFQWTTINGSSQYGTGSVSITSSQLSSAQ